MYIKSITAFIISPGAKKTKMAAPFYLKKKKKIPAIEILFLLIDS
jgi:hypothetical protein